jgi:hypothetical protein
MTKDEELAMDLALEALEPMQNSRDDTAIERAITAIKQARSAPVQKKDDYCHGDERYYAND